MMQVMQMAKTRITISLDDKVYSVLKQIADLTGSSMSGIVAELLEENQGTFEKMAVTLQRIKEAQKVHKDRMIKAMADHQESLEEAVGGALGQFDLFIGALEKATLDGGGGRGDEHADGGERRPSAPLTNRGATKPTRKGQKSKPGAASKGV